MTCVSAMTGAPIIEVTDSGDSQAPTQVPEIPRSWQQAAPSTDEDVRNWAVAFPQPGTASTTADESDLAAPFAAWAAKADGIAGAGGDAGARMKAIEKDLSAIGEVSEAATRTGPAAEAPATTAEDSLVEKLKEAIDAGNLKTDSQAGRLWRAALRAEPDLAADYKKTGKSYEKQRLFRVKWAKAKYADLVEKKTEEEGQENEDSVNGIYYPLGRIFTEEGGDESAVQATLNYAKECVRLLKEGVTVRGSAFIAWNRFTKRNEFLYLTKTMRDSVFQKHSHSRTWSSGSSGSAVVSLNFQGC